MTTDLVTTREDDSLIDLMRIMRRKGVRRMPVVGQQDELLGIVTLDDVLAILAEELNLLVAAIDSEGKRERVMRITLGRHPEFVASGSSRNLRCSAAADG